MSDIKNRKKLKQLNINKIWFRKNKNIYNKIKQFALEGLTTVDIACKLKLKSYASCYKIAEDFKDKKLIVQLKQNASVKRSVASRNYKLYEQNYSYIYEANRFKINVDKKLHTYTPDLKISDTLYIEIKGPLFKYDVKKMKSFKQQYPHLRLVLITGIEHFKKLKFCDVLIDYFKFIKEDFNINEIFKN